jgi:AraC-like DNA-binding protein/ligand-binding sensor protein
MSDTQQGIYFDDEVQSLVDSFTYCFKVRATILSADNKDLIVGFPYSLSNFCQLIRYDLKGYQQCRNQNRMMCRRCERMESPLVYQCHTGLTEAAIALKVDKKIVGYAMIGQFRMQETIPKFILQQWCDAGLDGTVLQKAFQELPFFDTITMNNMLRLFSMLVTFIITKEYVNVHRPALTESLIHWLEDHIAEPVSLDDAAAAMNKSPSTIYHTIKKNLGISFKQLCILRRIQRFESIIASDPDCTISEAAIRVGYDDSLYFSRLYKNVRHINPSNYVKSVRGK